MTDAPRSSGRPRAGSRAGGGREEWILWIALAVAFLPALAALAAAWASVEYYNHGFLVPVVSLLLAQPRWGRLSPSRRWSGGLLGLGAALGGYGAGLLFGSVALQGLALVGALSAMVAYRGGAAGLRLMALPLGFLLFMVPLPASIVNPLVVGLQTLASVAAVGTLQLFGVGVTRDGNVVNLPGGDSLFVAEACSGITSILSLVPIGVLLARFTETVTLRRWLIVAFVVPAALFGNAVRVIATVAAAQAWGAEAATSGPLHESAGLLTSAFAVLLVIGFGAALRRAFDGPKPSTAPARPPRARR